MMSIKKLLILIILLNSCKSEKKEGEKRDNDVEEQIVQVFLADPLSQKYISNKDWKEELIDRRKDYFINDSIGISKYSISESKEALMPFIILRFTGTNGFSHIFPYMDRYYYLYGGKVFNKMNGKDFCIEDISNILHQNVSIERHLNHIVSCEDYFLENQNQYDQEKLKLFLSYIMEEVFNYKKLSVENLFLMENQYEIHFKDFEETEKNLIANNYNKIKRRIDSPTYLYFIDLQMIYEVELPKSKKEKIKINAMNKEWFYFPLW
ncbi:MAG: hypothetical protein H0X62_06635 [Bacteroidetes bacterium]|nr:hypothetical protein [Bacteroidota bacterium]